MTRLVAFLVVTLSCAPGSLWSQDVAKWEYGRLLTIWGVPTVWIVGTVATQIDSATAVLDRTFKAQREILRGNRPQRADSGALTPATLLLTTMNRLGQEGWELVEIIPSPPIMPRVGAEPREESEMEYFFKRRKR